MNAICTRMRPAATSAFTLVEVTVAMLSAAILAVTSAVLLSFGCRSWLHLQQRAAMQCDAVAAMDVLTSAVRAGTNVVFAANNCTVQFDGFPNAVIAASGGNLQYQPNAACSNGFPLASGNLQMFAVNAGSNCTSIVVVLATGGEIISNTLMVTQRNIY